MSGITSAISTKTLGTTETVTLVRYGDGTLEFTPKTVTTGTLNSTTAISAVVSTLGWVKGMAISGTGIPAGATIVSFIPNTSCVISVAATATASAVALTVTKTRKAYTHGRRTQASDVEQQWAVDLFAAIQIVA